MSERERFKPGRRCIDPQGRHVEITATGLDHTGEWVEVRLGGEYGARVKLPPSTLRVIEDGDEDEDPYHGKPKSRKPK